MVALTMQFSFAQEKTITGLVSDASGPLPGVNVVVKGTQRGVSSGFDGRYSIKTKVGESLVFSFLGFPNISRTVGAENSINVLMKEEAKALDVIVVTSQGVKKQQKTLGYAVTTLKAESVEGKPQSDVIRSLQGKVAGLDIVNTGGMAGSTSNIVIRGQKSITGSSQPLFIVDGVPFDTSAGDITGSFAQGSSSSSSRFQDIDPNNIESISVLKGLAASVTYGSQGRNGVILITTKKGKNSEKVSVAYSSTLFFSEIANLPDYQNKYGGGSANNINTGTVGTWGQAFDPTILVASPYDIPSITTYFPQFIGVKNPWVAAENNVKDFFRTGVSNVHNLNISGGSSAIQYSLFGSYTNEEGMVINNNINKYNLGVNLSAKISEKLKASAAITYFNTKYSTPPVGAANSASNESIFKRTLYVPRNFDLSNLPYQNPVTGQSIYYRTDVTNPRWLLDNAATKQNVNRIFAKFDATYSINKHFDLTYRLGIDRYVDEQSTYVNKGSVENIYRDGYLRTTNGTNTILNNDLIFDIKPLNLSDSFKFNATLGLNSRRDTFSQNGISSQNQLSFGILDHSYFQKQSGNDPFVGDLNTPETFSNILGAYASTDFSFKDFLFLNLAGRIDYTSVVEKQNQSIVYPSASLSFIPTDAFKSIKGDILNYWKLRAAFGTSAEFPFLYTTRNFNNFNANIFTGGTQIAGVSALGNLGNPDLKPTRHQEIEFGSDLEMFNSRFTLGLSVYNRISRDQIIRRDLDPSTGYTTTYINAGRIDNEGIEANLSITPLKTENFNWTVSGIFTKNKSLVVELPEGQKRIRTAGFTNLGNFAVEGEPLGAIIGNYALKDANGNYLVNPTNGQIIRSDQVGRKDEIIGNPNPEFSLSVDNGFAYKGFKFNVLFEYVKGGSFYSNTIENLLRRGVTKDTEDREGSFIVPGFYGNPTTGNVLVDSNNNQIPNTIQLPLNDIYFLNTLDASSQNIYDATRLRLREASLGYSVPSKFLKGTGIDGLSFTVTGQNLWLKAFNIPKYTNVDPDLISTGTGAGRGLDFQTAPQSRRYGFSVKVNF
jgi:TonB-linked SusC/RagA family outer membrane protein